ncbi:hypothetical protein AALA82_13255 [Oscillospiraceae bacterium 50-16]
MSRFKLLKNTELSIGYTAAMQENSVNVLLGDSESGGLFILRRLDSRFLLFLGGKRVAYTSV